MGDVHPNEDLGQPKWNEVLAQLREQRLKLIPRLNEKLKSKKKSPNKKSALKKGQSSMSVFDNADATSAFTGYTSAMDKNIDSKDKITVDYFPM